MRARFLFRNEALQLLAFSLHKNGANLPELHPLHPWHPVDDPDGLNVIYEWGPDTFIDFSRELQAAGCYVFACSPHRSRGRANVDRLSRQRGA